MKKVIVLMDDENRQSNYVNKYSLGKNPMLAMLCRTQTKAEMENSNEFIYEVFGLFTDDKKLDDFLLKHDGLIVSIDTENFKKNSNLYLTQLLKLNNKTQNIPLAIVFDHNQKIKNDKLLNEIKISCKNILNDNSSHEVFIVGYTVENYSIAPEKINFNYEFHFNGEINRWFITQLRNSKKLTTLALNNKMSTKITSKNIKAIQLMNAFYNTSLPIDLWDHYGRLRVVWCSIIKFGFEETIKKDGWLCSSWKKYKTSIGHGDKWNYTLTRFWINVLAGIQETGKYKSFSQLYEANPKIHSGKLFMEYYGTELFTEEAKNNWIKPTKSTN